ncbi:hypothetical protein BD779DRAFT_1489505 [Infundibulicybe gibba]|nr:hypothetical protein BD779DRAFT_1489505 [Infundibulicybe gibba]
MFALMVLSSVATLLFIYFFMPALWVSIMAIDDSLDAHEAGLALVASRNPFRESGPPANMAKLILLRHKIQTTNRKRRNSSPTRQVSRVHISPQTRSKPFSRPSWIRLGRPFGGKQYH